MTARHYSFGVDFGDGSDVTMVLYGCDCGRLQTKVLDGSWSEQDLGIEPMKERRI